VQCEMCGQTVAATRRVIIDRTPLNVCNICAKFGTPTSPGTAARLGMTANVAEGLARRERRMGSKDVYSSERMTLELVDDYGARIQKAREAKGWTRQELGGRIKEPENAVARMESGSLHPTDAVAQRLEKELGIKLFEAVKTIATARKAR
jgi:putative transcription factor